MRLNSLFLLQNFKANADKRILPYGAAGESQFHFKIFNMTFWESNPSLQLSQSVAKRVLQTLLYILLTKLQKVSTFCCFSDQVQVRFIKMQHF